MRHEYYDALARYFAKYVQAYLEHGVAIDFLECFNEPTDSYTVMDAAQLAELLGKHVGPTFERLGLWPKVKVKYLSLPSLVLALTCPSPHFPSSPLVAQRETHGIIINIWRVNNTAPLGHLASLRTPLTPHPHPPTLSPHSPRTR